MIPENAVTALAQLDGHIFQVQISINVCYSCIFIVALVFLHAVVPAGPDIAHNTLQDKEGEVRAGFQCSRQFFI